jgi:hypothetical protein
VNVSQANASYFRFLRDRCRFVAEQAHSESIEGFVVWAAAVDALSRIHAGRVGVDIKKNRKCFTRGLVDLAPQHGLDTVSVPLLWHDIRTQAPTLAEHGAFLTYRAAARSSRLWTIEEDKHCASSIAVLKAAQSDAAKLAGGNDYASLLYLEYRCCAVHGLELGRKTCRPFDKRMEPHYMNYRYSDDDQRTPEHRYRTRIVFPLIYLARLLDEMIDSEEQASAAAAWAIPAYPTLT